MANKNDFVVYTGITCDLGRRVFEHKIKFKKNSFTSRYDINKLVYCEDYGYANNAIAGGKQIKAGPRKKKTKLVESINKI